MERGFDCSVCYLQFAASFHHSEQCIEKCLFKSDEEIELKRIPLFTGKELLEPNQGAIYDRRASDMEVAQEKDSKTLLDRSKRTVGLKELCLENPHSPPCLQALKKLRSSNLMR